MATPRGATPTALTMTPAPTPAPDAASHDGSCYCGAVRFTLAGAASLVVNCHCSQCRRLSGAAFTTWACYSRTAVLVTTPEALTRFQVTPRVLRHFCATCGSHVYTEDNRNRGILGLPSGVLEGAALPPPTAHCYVDDRAPWHTITDSLPQRPRA
jgi:hypothetical protein